MSLQDDRRKLLRLREKRARLDRHISRLAAKLKGSKATWGNASNQRKR